MGNRQSNIVGTPEHERRKKQMKERQAKLVGTPEHQWRKQKMKSQLANVVGTPEYEKLKAKVCFKKLQNTNSASLKIDTSKKAILQGPFLICVVCNRCLYRKSVCLFRAERYNISESIFTSVSSFDGLFYICITCDSKVIKGKTPCQAVYNKLQVEHLPQQFDNIRRLEKV